MDTALINIAHEGPAWLEWAAAMYESHHADHDVEAPAGYAQAAHRLAEEIESETFEREDLRLQGLDLGLRVDQLLGQLMSV